jgi:hypothetical protein
MREDQGGLAFRLQFHVTKPSLETLRCITSPQPSWLHARWIDATIANSIQFEEVAEHTLCGRFVAAKSLKSSQSGTSFLTRNCCCTIKSGLIRRWCRLDGGPKDLCSC